MKKYTSEFKVGLFILLALAALAYLTLSTGKFDFKKKGYRVYAIFNEVAGLDKKAPVMLNGLEVGKVEDIEPLYNSNNTQIKLTLWLNDGVMIRENPEISIKTLGLMGEKYIQISSYCGENFLAPEAVVTGRPYVDLDSLMATLNSSLDENRQGVADIVKNFAATSKNFEDFSADIKRNPWKLLFKTKEKPAKASGEKKEGL